MLLFIVDSLKRESEKVFVKNLYEDYMPLLRARAYKIVKDYDVCDDLAHDCMVNIIKHTDFLSTLPEDRQLAYIAVAIDNTSKNYLKVKTKNMTGISGDVSSCATDANSVEEEIERKYNYESMRRGFENMREKDKHIMIMKYELDFNDAQIAQTLGIKKNSVRMTVRRCISRLKEEIEKLEE